MGVNYSYDSDSDWDDSNEDREKTSKGMGTNLIVSQSSPFKMNDDIYGYVNISKENDNNEKNPTKTEEFQIKLCSDTLDADQLRLVLQGWVKEYEQQLDTIQSSSLSRANHLTMSSTQKKTTS